MAAGGLAAAARCGTCVPSRRLERGRPRCLCCRRMQKGGCGLLPVHGASPTERLAEGTQLTAVGWLARPLAAADMPCNRCI